MTASTDPRRARVALLLPAVVLLAFQLRGALVAPAPVAADAQADWAVGPAALGLLTALPVLCFALATPLALLLQRRFGLEGAIRVGLVGVVLATLLRSVGPFPVALAASVMLGAAITVGNVLVPTLIRRDVPLAGRGVATGAYTVALNVATMLSALATAPLAGSVGWRAAVAAWALPGLLTVLLWSVPLLRRNEHVGAPPVPGARERLVRDPLPWLLVTMFAGQSFSYYGLTSWLPTLLAEERGFDAVTAGGLSSVFQVAGAGGAVLVPLLALRVRPAVVVGLVGLLWISLPIGLLVAPEAYLALSVAGGLAQGGGFTAVLTIVAQVARDTRHATVLSAFVQAGGYVAAALAAPLLGALRQVTGGWTAPVAVVVGTTATFLVFGVLAALTASRRTKTHPR